MPLRLQCQWLWCCCIIVPYTHLDHGLIDNIILYVDVCDLINLLNLFLLGVVSSSVTSSPAVICQYITK